MPNAKSCARNLPFGARARQAVLAVMEMKIAVQEQMNPSDTKPARCRRGALIMKA